MFGTVLQFYISKGSGNWDVAVQQRYVGLGRRILYNGIMLTEDKCKCVPIYS